MELPQVVSQALPLAAPTERVHVPKKLKPCLFLEKQQVDFHKTQTIHGRSRLEWYTGGGGGGLSEADHAQVFTDAAMPSSCDAASPLRPRWRACVG